MAPEVAKPTQETGVVRGTGAAEFVGNPDGLAGGGAVWRPRTETGFTARTRYGR